jgi:large subunit ribosomal protein L9
LVGNAITLQARAAGDRLFGSVSAADIVRQVEAQTGAVVDRKDLVLEEPIKTVGEHSVRVELLGGVVFELTVNVVAEG